MKSAINYFTRLLCLWFLTLSITSPAKAQSAVCQGQFGMFIENVCWDCMFPIKLTAFDLPIGGYGMDYETFAPRIPICVCPQRAYAVGTPMSFWEPRTMIDVTNKPGCMPLLGGLDIVPPWNTQDWGGYKQQNGQIAGASQSAHMHANMYHNPLLSILGMVAKNACIDDRIFEIPFLSWADPSWTDDALSLLLTPYAYAFANIVTMASEIPDAISATFYFPIPLLFWVAGSWGPMYPLNGNVASYKTPEQVAHLLSARVLAKMHAAGFAHTTAGPGAFATCGFFGGGVPEPIMNKMQYKTNRLLPFPDMMCTPIGRPLMLQEIGTTAPQFKDYGYMIFGKKDCCLTTY
jgi:conjugal transfer pilus assembly protein TraU